MGLLYILLPADGKPEAIEGYRGVPLPSDRRNKSPWRQLPLTKVLLIVQWNPDILQGP